MSDEPTLHSLQMEQYRQAAVIAAWQKDVSQVQVDVALVSKLLTDGNGGPPITVRLAIVEEKLDGLRAMLEEGRRGRWDLTKTALAALLAVVSGVLTALLAR